MNTSTGIFHTRMADETFEAFEKRTGSKPGELVEVARMPDGVCKKCGGTGRKLAGMFSRRFKPCDCVL